VGNSQDYEREMRVVGEVEDETAETVPHWLHSNLRDIWTNE
jgi:hypothetical protein